MVSRLYAALAALVFLLAGLVVSGPAQAATSSTLQAHAVCDNGAKWQCRSEVIATRRRQGATGLAASRVGSDGWWADELEAEYNPQGLTPTGTPTIAIIDPYNYPTAEADLAIYRDWMNLPPCTKANGCLSIVNQNLQTSPLPANAPKSPTDDLDNWTVEDSLDLDVASAMCPACHLMLVEADNDQSDNLPTAAVNATAVADYISMSWGAADDGTLPANYFDKPGKIFTGATGDNGYTGNQPDVYLDPSTGKYDGDMPSTMTNVVAVGGVTLNNVGATASAWTGSGSSCSLRIPKTSAQSTIATGCSHKAASDVSALADSDTPYNVYNDYTGVGDNGTYYIQVGGTSGAAPLMAGLYAIAGNHTDPFVPYVNARDYSGLFQDVTTGGSNGTCGAPLCRAGVGWDGLTGVGMPLTPNALAVPPDLGSMVVSGSTITGTYGTATHKTMTVTLKDINGTSARLGTGTVTGLPAGLRGTISGSTLAITGTPKVSGDGTTSLTLAGTTAGGRSATGTASLTWHFAQAFATSGKVRISGKAKPRKVVRAVLPALHTNTTAGAAVAPTWRVQWVLRGKVVHTGRTYRLPAKAHGRLVVRARATRTYFTTRTFTSAARTVR